MSRKFPLILILLVVAGTLAQAQGRPGLSFTVAPYIDLPVGASADRFSLAGGASLTGEYGFRALPLLQLLVGLNYDLLRTSAEDSVNAVSLGAGTGASYAPIPRLQLKASVTGGPFLAMYAGKAGFTGYFDAGGSIGYNFSRAFGLGLGASYKHVFASGQPFFQGVSAYLGSSFRIGANKTRQPLLQIKSVELLPVFPVLHKYYDDHPLGKLILQNKEKGPITDVQVSLFVGQYMESPKLCAQLPELRKDQEAEVALYALISEGVLGITENTKVQTDIVVEYSSEGDRLVSKQVQTLRVYDRNATTWDDDRKAAAFVTAKDPNILNFSKRIAGLVRDEETDALKLPLLVAIGLHEALRLQGVSYVPDPSTPYVTFSQDKAAVDFLQFPSQTLQYKAGDCDDLSILRCALLESVGIETAFVTVPAHVFMAFAVDIDPAKIERYFASADQLIVAEGKVWIPLEVTATNDGFLKAWQLGARQWREFQAKGQAAFLPTRASWELYEAVGLQVPLEGSAAADEAAVLKRFHEQKKLLVDSEIQSRVEQYQREIKASRGNPRYPNLLGALYARYGLYAEAEAQFKAALASGEYLPAIINMGSIFYVKGELTRALEFYQRALRKNPNDPRVVLSVARTYHEMDRLAEATEYFARLKDLDPKLAAANDYLEKGETRRAAKAGVLETEWEDQ